MTTSVSSFELYLHQHLYLQLCLCSFFTSFFSHLCSVESCSRISSSGGIHLSGDSLSKVGIRLFELVQYCNFFFHLLLPVLSEFHQLTTLGFVLLILFITFGCHYIAAFLTQQRATHFYPSILKSSPN